MSYTTTCALVYLANAMIHADIQMQELTKTSMDLYNYIILWGHVQYVPIYLYDNILTLYIPQQKTNHGGYIINTI